MNERIEEFAKHCYVNTGSPHTDHFEYWKFAELLIQDCIEIIEPCKCGCCHGEPEGYITDSIIKEIKEHFGVSE